MKKIKRYGHPIFFMLVLFLGIAIGNRIPVWRGLNEAEPYPMAVVAVTILLVSMFKDRLFESSAIRTLEDIKEDSHSSLAGIRTWIEEHLTPTIVSLDERDKVLNEASKIINTAMNEIESKQHVLYIGSGDLLKDPPPTHEGDKYAAVTEYISTMTLLKSKPVKITRYISLLDPHDYRHRGPETREAYKKWLAKQIEQLRGNSDYSIFDCPRAPTWGSTRSSIITDRAILDIVGNGRSGVLIRGDQIARELKKSSEQLLLNAAVRPDAYGADRLEQYMAGLEAPTPKQTDKTVAVTEDQET